MSALADAAPRGGQRSAVAARWRELDRRQPSLARAGAVFLLLGLCCLAAMPFDPRALNGVDVWVKPAKFHVSVAVYLWTLAWFFPYLGERDRRGWLGRLVVWGGIAGMVVEMAYISLQAARGAPSHFNVATPLASAMYTAMGAFATLAVAYPALMGLAVAARGDRRAGGDPLHRQAAALGLILGGILGGIGGWAIALNGAHWVGGTPDDSLGLPLLGWSRDGGDLRVPHFLGLHAMQAVPVAGAIIARARSGVRAGPLALWAFAAAYAALALATLAQAAAGRPFAPFLG